MLQDRLLHLVEVVKGLQEVEADRIAATGSASAASALWTSTGQVWMCEQSPVFVVS
jgi:hypothetical protein